MRKHVEVRMEGRHVSQERGGESGELCFQYTVLTLPFPKCVTLGKLLPPSELPFPCLQNEGGWVIFLRSLLAP